MYQQSPGVGVICGGGLSVTIFVADGERLSYFGHKVEALIVIESVIIA